MSKEITKAYILQQIEDKFKMREFEPGDFLFSETVVPIYDIAPHLLSPFIDVETVSITSGPSGFLFFTVPGNERWRLHGYNIIFMAAGAYTVTGLYIMRATPGRSYYLDISLGQTVSYSHDLPKDVVLDPGDRINVYIDTYTSTADLRLYIDVTKENIR